MSPVSAGYSDIYGSTITDENGNQFFVYGKNYIKITEHFAPDGKSVDELIEELVCHKIKEKTSKIA